MRINHARDVIISIYVKLTLGLTSLSKQDNKVEYKRQISAGVHSISLMKKTNTKLTYEQFQPHAYPSKAVT